MTHQAVSATYLGGPDSGKTRTSPPAKLGRYEARRGAQLSLKRGDSRLYGRVTGKVQKGLYVRRDLDGMIIYEWIRFSPDGWPIYHTDDEVRSMLNP